MEHTGHPTVVSLTRALRRLEGRALIERTTHGRRTLRIGITESGVVALGAVPAAATGVLIERLDKNQRSARVGIDRGTMDAIEGHVDFLAARAAAAGTKLRRDAFLFTDDLQGAAPWPPDSTTRKFARLMERLRMDYTLHSLRHFHITELLSGGANDGVPMSAEAVAARVGDDPRTIYKVYAHWRKDADQRAARHMEQFFAQGPSRPKLRAL